jgi:hypothetical protein
MSTMYEKKDTIFNNISAENPVIEVESVCMSCYEKVYFFNNNLNLFNKI